MNDPYTPIVRSMIYHLVKDVVIPRVFKDEVGQRLGFSGSVEVEGKLYALYFRRLNNMTAEISVTRNSSVIKWTCRQDLFNDMSLQIDQHPGPGACGYASYLNDPWLMMRVFATYIDNNPLIHY